MVLQKDWKVFLSNSLPPTFEAMNLEFLNFSTDSTIFWQISAHFCSLKDEFEGNSHFWYHGWKISPNILHSIHFYAFSKLENLIIQWIYYCNDFVLILHSYCCWLFKRNQWTNELIFKTPTLYFIQSAKRKKYVMH